MSTGADRRSLVARRLPVYLIIDHSASTTGAPLVSINGGVHSLREHLGPSTVCHLVYVGLISFAGTVSTTVLTPVDQFAPARLEVAHGCNLGAALERLRSALERDLIHAQGAHLGDHTPMVIVMLGGSPTDSWQSTGAWLHQEIAAKHVNVIGVALNRDAVDVLRGVCSTVLCFMGNHGADVTSFFRWLSTAIEEMARMAADGATSAHLPPLPRRIVPC